MVFRRIFSNEMYENGGKHPTIPCGLQLSLNGVSMQSPDSNARKSIKYAGGWHHGIMAETLIAVGAGRRIGLRAAATYSSVIESSRPGSVVNADVNVLFTWRQDVLLLLALQVWQFINCLTNNSQRGLNLLLGNHERWCQTDDVLVSGFGLQRR